MSTTPFTFRWLEAPPYRLRGRSRFRSTYSQTLSLLTHELSHLRARDVILAAGYLPSHIRLDGLPHARAEAQHPAVELHFDIPPTGQRPGYHACFPCATYSTWRENLHAITLSLEALRKVNRYGVTQGNEQYQGWMRLAAPDPVDTLAKHAGCSREKVLADPKWAYRQAALHTHPDRPQGSADAFREVEHAYRELQQGTQAQ